MRQRLNSYVRAPSCCIYIPRLPFMSHATCAGRIPTRACSLTLHICIPRLPFIEPRNLRRPHPLSVSLPSSRAQFGSVRWGGRRLIAIHGEPVSTPEAESVVRLSFALRISNLGHGGRHSGERQAGRRTGFSVALWVFHPKPRHTQIESTRGAIVNALVLCVTIDPVRSAINKAAHPPHRWRRERVDLHLREVENPPSARQLHPNVLRQMRALVQ